MDNWEVGSIETPTNASLYDEGKGQATVLRKFELLIHPDLMKIEDDNEVLEHFKGETMLELWKQGLELITDLRLVRNVHNKQLATIFAVCKVKQGEILHPIHSPQTIQDALR